MIGLPHQLKLAAYVHSLKDLPRFKRAGFSYVALHPTLFPSVEGGIPPPAEKIQEVRKAVEASGLVPYDLATFNAWNWLGLSGMMEQLPSGPSDPEYEEIRKRGVKQYVGLIKLTKALGALRSTCSWEGGGSITTTTRRPRKSRSGTSLRGSRRSR